MESVLKFGQVLTASGFLQKSRMGMLNRPVFVVILREMHVMCLSEMKSRTDLV